MKLAAILVLFSCAVSGQGFGDPSATAEQRAAALVARMTLEEKVLQMQNGAPAIPRLGIPAYDWWNEALHGVARAGQATVFTQAIGLAATWDTDLMHRIADIISTEARAKYNEAIRNNDHSRYRGLTFWSPNINIFRDPRWGRGQETYGEDPFLTGRLAVAFITGMQGTDPHYFKVVATAKHYAVHSGPESSRHSFDVVPSARDLAETYLPAFRASIVEGKADSVMCAYNRVDGVPACANTDLLQKYLRQEWGFNGFVVSDCGAISDIFRGHKYKPNAAEASAVAVKAGTDLTCGTEYRALVDAVKNGLIAEKEVDAALVRLFTARFKLGMFDPPDRVPFNAIPYSEVDSAEHRAVALEAARKSIVLLKNDGILPLKATVKKIAVIGPAADDAEALLGNYNGFSRHHVTPLEGMQRQWANKAEIVHATGATYTAQSPAAIPASALRNLKTEYSANNAVWTGTLRAPGTGEYTFTARTSGRPQQVRILLDAQEGARATLEAGHDYAFRAEFRFTGFEADAKVLWTPPAAPLLAEAVNAAKSAEAVVAFVGLNPSLEGEEMRVAIPGFQGGDRTDLELPAPQEQLIEAVAATGKPLIVVLTSGSALAVRYAAEHANAVLESWYNGEEAGTAIADTLSGVSNPAGRLPVTFYRNVDQLPAFDDYAMKGRTYRYFRGDALWSFGFGLSYAKFSYANLKARRSANSAVVTVRVKNDSAVEGDEVVQLYLAGNGGADDAIRSLRGFQRVHLRTGESREVQFTLGKPDLPANKVKLSVGGGQPLPGIAHVEGTL